MKIFSLKTSMTHLVEHVIDTGDLKPIRQALRRQPLAHLDKIDKEVEQMCKYGFIEPAASPWASNIIHSQEKGRFYENMRKLKEFERNHVSRYLPYMVQHARSPIRVS